MQHVYLRDATELLSDSLVNTIFILFLFSKVFAEFEDYTESEFDVIFAEHITFLRYQKTHSKNRCFLPQVKNLHLYVE